MASPDTSSARAPDRLERGAAALCFFLPFLAYTQTASRTVQGGDTAEFAMLGVFGGVAHPSGYPLYTLLARLASLVPIDPLFFRIGLASALCGAAAIVVLQRVSLRLTGSLWASVAAALAFAFSGVQWRLAGVPEVFTLNALLAMSTVLMALRLAAAHESSRAREAFGLGVAFGLGGSNHLTIVLCLPMILWALASVARHGAGGAARAMGAAVGGGLVGLLPYAWLPYAATHAAHAALVWGEPQTWHGFLFHVLRRQYGTFSIRPGTESPLIGATARLGTYFDTLPAELGYLLLLAAVVGVVVSLLRPSGPRLALAATLAAAVAFLILIKFEESYLQTTLVERFYLLPNVLLAPFIAIGLAVVEKRLTPVMRGGVTIAGVALVATIALPHANWRADNSVERYLVECVKELEPNSVLLGEGDEHFATLFFVTQAMQIRPDVRYVDINFLGWRWYYDFVRRQVPEYPVKFIPGEPAPPGHLAGILIRGPKPTPTYTTSIVEPGMTEKVGLEPEGFVSRAVDKDRPPIPAATVRARLERATEAFGDHPAPPIDGWSFGVRDVIARRWDALADQYAQEQQPQEADFCRGLAAVLHPAAPAVPATLSDMLARVLHRQTESPVAGSP